MRYHAHLILAFALAFVVRLSVCVWLTRDAR